MLIRPRTGAELIMKPSELYPDSDPHQNPLSISPQADVQVFHLAHVCSGNHRLRRDDVPDQRHLRVCQYRLHAAAAAADPLPESRQQLGLHQPGAHLPPGTGFVLCAAGAAPELSPAKRCVLPPDTHTHTHTTITAT